jgi:hypothetical protein
VANDDIVIGGGDTTPGQSAHGHVVLVLTLLVSAKLPMAVLLLPSMLLARGRTPRAALLKPVVLAASALKPVAVLEPTSSFWSALIPIAVAPNACMPFDIAPSPTAVWLIRQRRPQARYDHVRC